jgi:hypothetical protein
MSQYIFPGLWPFIEKVSHDRGLQHLGRARELWHCRQIQDALGQLPRLDPNSQAELLAHVLKVRASLAVALEGIDSAIAEVAGAFNLQGQAGSLPDQEWRAGQRASAESVEKKRKKDTTADSSK